MSDNTDYLPTLLSDAALLIEFEDAAYWKAEGAHSPKYESYKREVLRRMAKRVHPVEVR